MEKILVRSTADTTKVAKDLSRHIKKGGVVCLYGQLGAGKTTFIQGLAQGLGLNKKIISPTFIIVRPYSLHKQVFYHIDLYRLEDGFDIQSIGLLEILNNNSNIIAIEWPEKIEKFLPQNRINIYFKYINDTTRELIIDRGS